MATCVRSKIPSTFWIFSIFDVGCVPLLGAPNSLSQSGVFYVFGL